MLLTLFFLAFFGPWLLIGLVSMLIALQTQYRTRSYHEYRRGPQTHQYDNQSSSQWLRQCEKCQKHLPIERFLPQSFLCMRCARLQ